MRTAFKQCPRKVFYRYVAGVETRRQQSPARAIGKAFHTGVEGWRNDVGSDLAMSGANAILQRELRAMGYGDETINLEAARLDAYLLGYFARWEGESDKPGKWQTEVRLEEAGEIAFVDTVHIDRKGFAWIWEEKTTGRFEPATELVLGMDEQLLNYALLLQKAGYKVGGAVYRQTLKTKKEPLKPKKESLSDFRARLIDEYRKPEEDGNHNAHYREFVVQFDGNNLAEYANDKEITDEQITLLLRHHRSLTHVQRNTFSCIGKFGACDFLGLCARRCDADGEFKANGKAALDGGSFQRKIWGEKYDLIANNRSSGGPSAAPGTGDDDAWAYE